MAFIYDLADTWNDAGTTFTAIKMDVTDTASNAASLLMDLQVGGSSKFSVDKNGQITSGRGIYVNSSFAQSYGLGITNSAKFVSNSGMLQLSLYNNSNVLYPLTVKNINCEYATFGVSSSSPAVGGDTRLYADAADTLAQRNSTNAQTFNLYNTRTDASNYERGFMKWNSNVLEIGTEALGTGTARAVSLYGATVTIDGPGDSSYTLKRNGTQHISAGSAGPRFSFPPYPSGTVDLGLAEIPWRDVYLKPSSSLTPQSNGDLCIEATDNTTLTFKYKGSDGVVRSGTVALS